MKKIIVATDFSPAARNACNYATDMALTLGAQIMLVHIYQLPVGYAEVPAPMNVEELCEECDELMQELRTQLLERCGDKVYIETHIRTGIFFHTELKAICDETRPYALVMGSQGTTQAVQLLFGSHTVHAMAYLDWPLITVPPMATFKSVKNIGLACDFSKVADTSPVDEIKAIMQDFGAELHILNISNSRKFDAENDYESAALENMLGEVKHTYYFALDENTDKAIIDFAETNHLDLLIVLPGRHGLLGKLLHRSHSKHLVLHSHVPVLALHEC